MSGFQAYTLIIGTAPTIIVNPSTLPTATRNLPYSQNITATGGTAPYTFSISGGALPAGLALSTTGTLSGTPTAAGTFTFTIRAQDTLGNPGTRLYNLLVGVGAYDSAPAPGNIINVGTVQIGTAISVNFTTYNRGTAPIIVGTPSISATNAADFAVFTNIPLPAPQFPYALNANGQQAITVRCIPSAAGLRQALLTLPISGDPTRASAIYVLQCTGSGTAIVTATPIGFVPTATAFVPTVTPVVPANGTVGEVKGLAMRTGPYLGATLIGKAIPGVSYPILAQSNDEGGGITWYLITVDTVTGWVSGLYLNVAGNIGVVPFQGSIFDQIDGAPDVGVTARAMSIIDIRRRPSGRAAILTQVPQDGIVRLLGRTRQNGGDFWVQVNYNGVIGWIPAAPIAVNGSTGNVPIR